MESEQTTTRCTECRAEFTEAQLVNVPCCPSCGTKGAPMSIAEDTTIQINWHELRILTIWADNWARSIGGQDGKEAVRCLSSILRELDKQRPEGAAALTLFGEVRELQEEFPDAELRDGEGNVLVPKRNSN